jgi:hypothetical protein
MRRISMFVIGILILSNIAIAVNDEVSVNYVTDHTEKGIINTIVTIKGNSEVQNLKIQIQQSDTVLDSSKGFFDSSSGPAENSPTVIKYGMFGYSIPTLKQDQYIKMTYSSSPNKKCDDVNVGRLILTYEGGQIEQALQMNITCENEESPVWKYIAIILVVIIAIIIVIGIYKLKNRGL